ncbi:MAG: poly-beta-1,6-N-acetyl-D-glucosamine biosynthesis protein PgaD [Deltaproteobacteria bacterium]|nr:MAG: poly-beta-1,6-N-acetyl-D-glucosamine biosynthesis protein PgaD [Deltaproteobacteria bacterium]
MKRPKRYTYVINDPSLKSGWQKFVELFITLLMWYWFLYSAFPFFRGVSLVIYQMIQENVSSAAQQHRDVFFVMAYLGAFIIIILSIMILWIAYNKIRFGKSSKTEAPEDASDSNLASFFEISEQDVKTLQNKKDIVWNKPYIRRK